MHQSCLGKLEFLSESPGGAGESLTQHARMGMGGTHHTAKTHFTSRALMTAHQLMSEHEVTTGETALHFHDANASFP